MFHCTTFSHLNTPSLVFYAQNILCCTELDASSRFHNDLMGLFAIGKQDLLIFDRNVYLFFGFYALDN